MVRAIQGNMAASYRTLPTEHLSITVLGSQDIVCDQTVALSGFCGRRKYPHHLRRIRFKDPDTGHTPVFLTNLFGSTPKIVCEPCKAHWQAEMFFR